LYNRSPFSLFVVDSGGASRWAPLSLLVVALPVVVDVTSGRFCPLIFGRQQAQTIVLANLWK
jgi:hypothetical protein